MENPLVDMTQARLNVTFAGQNGDLPDTIANDLADADIVRIAQEAIRGGGVPGIIADPNASLQDFVVERFPPNEAFPWSRAVVRPKTPFGLLGVLT